MSAKGRPPRKQALTRPKPKPPKPRTINRSKKEKEPMSNDTPAAPDPFKQAEEEQANSLIPVDPPPPSIEAVLVPEPDPVPEPSETVIARQIPDDAEAAGPLKRALVQTIAFLDELPFLIDSHFGPDNQRAIELKRAILDRRGNLNENIGSQLPPRPVVA